MKKDGGSKNSPIIRQSKNQIKNNVSNEFTIISEETNKKKF